MTSSLTKVSAKQRAEYRERRKLKLELWAEQEGICGRCGKQMTWHNPLSDNYPHLSHDKSLARGGKTNKDNCSVICGECHSNGEHHLRNKYNEQPQWTKP